LLRSTLLRVAGTTVFALATAVGVAGGAYAASYSGTDGSDSITGTYERDQIALHDGNDFGYGRGDNDRIFGGGGNDTLRGQKGDDFMYGGPGADQMWGGPGDDTIAAWFDNRRDYVNCGNGDNDWAKVDVFDTVVTASCERITTHMP
jgi:Ca2+-binding RTX toxin-like protein